MDLESSDYIPFVTSEDITNASPEPLPAPVDREPIRPAVVGRGPQHTIWCFTCNNPSPQAFIAYDTAVSSGKCAFLGYELEHAE